MTFHPVFVPGGVYLRTSSGELIGRLDKPGAPFETLDEARVKADWLDMVIQFQQSQRQQDSDNAVNAIPAAGKAVENQLA